LNLFKFFFNKNDYEEEIEEKSFRTRKKIKKILRQEIKVQEIRKKYKIYIKNSILFFFISITNGIVFICGYCMLVLNLHLLLIFAIIGNICMLHIQ
jgi:hypothetical protein